MFTFPKAWKKHREAVSALFAEALAGRKVLLAFGKSCLGFGTRHFTEYAGFDF